jgi:hypothetical protein
VVGLGTRKMEYAKGCWVKLCLAVEGAAAEVGEVVDTARTLVDSCSPSSDPRAQERVVVEVAGRIGYNLLQACCIVDSSRQH